MKNRPHHGYRASGGVTRGSSKYATHTTSVPRLGDAGAPSAAKVAPKALRDQARWMHYHEIALMPARRGGGEAEVRRVLKQACADGLVTMSDAQIEQEVRDVMAAPD